MKKISFLGEIIIILVIFAFVLLFVRQGNTNSIKNIQHINDKFNVQPPMLVAIDTKGYIAELSFVELKDVTQPIIEFNKLADDSAKIEEQIYRASVAREDCITRELKLNILSTYTTIEKLEKKFIELNVKKYYKLNIKDYLNFLKNIKKTYTSYKSEIEKIPVCENI